MLLRPTPMRFQLLSFLRSLLGICNYDFGDITDLSIFDGFFCLVCFFKAGQLRTSEEKALEKNTFPWN